MIEKHEGIVQIGKNTQENNIGHQTRKRSKQKGAKKRIPLSPLPIQQLVCIICISNEMYIHLWL